MATINTVAQEEFEEAQPSPARFSETGTSLGVSSYVEVEFTEDHDCVVSELDDLEKSVGKMSRNASAASDLTKMQHRPEPTLPVLELEPVQVETDQALFMSSNAEPVPEVQAVNTETSSYDKEFKEIEAKAAKLAQGLMSAFGGATGATSSIAGGFSSWLTSLDSTTEQRDAPQNVTATVMGKVSPKLQTLLGLRKDETVMEMQPCRAVQTYSCSHNKLTPPIQLVFQGTLYITEWNTCFCGDERGRPVPFKIPHESITRVERLRMARSKGSGGDDSTEVVRIDIEGEQHVLFSDFSPSADLDSMMALLEGLLED